MLRLVDGGLSKSKIPLHITESDTLSYKSEQGCFENTIHCIATKFRNPGMTNERKLKEYNLLNRTFNVFLDGTVFSFGIFSNNNAFKRLESYHNMAENLTGAEKIISNITEISYVYRK